MPMAQVQTLLGRPDGTEGKLCGKMTKEGQFKCVVWTYWTDNQYMSLRVYFERSTSDPDALVVNSWEW